MKIGKDHEEEKDWTLSALTIQESSNYKYFGDVITNDEKNMKNIKKRKAKIFATTTAISAIAATETLRCIETEVLLELHEQEPILAIRCAANAFLNRRNGPTDGHTYL